MNRTIIEVPQAADRVRSIVRIEDDPSQGDGHLGFWALGQLLQNISQQPQLLRHASDCPSEVTIIHDGHRWVIESVSVIERPVR